MIGTVPAAYPRATRAAVAEMGRGRMVSLVTAVAALVLIGGLIGAELTSGGRPLEQPIAPRPAGVVGGLPTGAATQVVLQPVATGLKSPLAVVSAGDGSGRLFVAEKEGTIRIVRNGRVEPTPFLDITPLVRSRESERGLLGLAFHPRYSENGSFFVNYTDQDGHTVIARYQVSENPDIADPASASIVLFQTQPYANHNGGNLVFGPDGYLWIGLGDGGSGGDPQGNAQNGQTYLGKMLRLDVDNGSPYVSPPSNPFVGDPTWYPEIWAIGLRNPWRYSFDRLTGDLWVADVGQNRWEEINVLPAGTGAGGNFGWKMMEGAHCFTSDGCDPTGLIMPIAEYDHEKGCSITGGYVYRGAAYPNLFGLYLSADYCSGRIWTVAPNGDGAWTHTEVLKSNAAVSSFGEDEAGEVYLTDLRSGILYQVTAP